MAVRSSFDEDRLRELHGRGLYDGEIGRQLGVSSHVVWAYRKKHGIPANPTNHKHIGIARILPLYSQGLSDVEIGRQLGVSSSTVERYRKRSNLPANKQKVNPGGKPRFDRDLAGELLRAGVTHAKVAAELNCTIRTVDRIARELGLSKPNPHEGLEPIDKRLAEAEILLDEGYSFKDIKNRLHLHERTLGRYFPGRSWGREQVSQWASLQAQSNKLYKKLGV